MVNINIPKAIGSNSTKARHKPLQARALERHQQILDITAELLDKVGIDDLTTVLIAQSLNISVGSLYRYFPNKIAILYALAERWLDEITQALDEIDEMLVDNQNLQFFSEQCTDRLVEAYRDTQGLLPLVQAMFSIPELKALDDEHDQYMIGRFSKMFIGLGFTLKKAELTRIADIYLELVHALSINIISHPPAKARKNIADLKFLVFSILSKYHPND